MHTPEQSLSTAPASLHSYAHPEKFWQSLEDEVLSELELLIRRGLYARVPENDELTDILAREEAFVVAIIQKLHQVFSHGHAQALLFFDIDETCVTAVTQPRPSLTPLLNRMRSDCGSATIEMGILSNRDQENLERLFQPGQILERLSSFIHPRQVHSAIPVSYQIARWLGTFEGGLATKHSKQEILHFLGMDQTWAGLLDWDRFLAENDLHLYDYLTVGKLKTLAPIRERIPEHTALMVVDDLPFTKTLRAEKGMYGVHVDEPKRPLEIHAMETSQVFDSYLTKERIAFLLDNLDDVFPSAAEQPE